MIHPTLELVLVIIALSAILISALIFAGSLVRQSPKNTATHIAPADTHWKEWLGLVADLTAIAAFFFGYDNFNMLLERVGSQAQRTVEQPAPTTPMIRLDALEPQRGAGFELQVPSSWKLASGDLSAPQDGVKFTPTGDALPYAMLQIDMTPIGVERPRQELQYALEQFIEENARVMPDYQIEDGIDELVDGTLAKQWSYNYTHKGQTTRLRATSYIIQRSGSISVLTIVVPAEQYAALEAQIQQIRESYRVGEPTN